jgi:hypothetical protein
VQALVHQGKETAAVTVQETLRAVAVAVKVVLAAHLLLALVASGQMGLLMLLGVLAVPPGLVTAQMVLLIEVMVAVAQKRALDALVVMAVPVS